MGFGLPPISRLLSLVKGPVLFPRLFFTTCETQRAVRNCCSINIFRWYRSVHINGIDPSPITFLIHSGQGKNNLSSLSASQQPFLSALALYCWQFHHFRSIEPHCSTHCVRGHGWMNQLTSDPSICFCPFVFLCLCVFFVFVFVFVFKPHCTMIPLSTRSCVKSNKLRPI